jgi:serine/threonine protein kinase
MDSVNLEMIQRKKDAWSLGIILYEMLVCPLTKDDYLLSVSRSSADDFYKAQSLVQKYSIRTDLLVINNHLKSKTSKANWCKYFEKLTEDLIQKDRSNELLSEMKKALDLLIVNLLDLNPLDRMSSTQALIKFEEITKNFLSN